MNLSSLWKLPIVWVCVNNQYGMGTAFERVSAAANVADRAAAYAMPGCVVDGNDVLAVYAAMIEARERALAGEGPTLIECKTYRHRGHSTFDKNNYRPQAEIEAWLARDPLVLYERWLRGQGLLDDAAVAEVMAGAARQVDAAEAFAVASPEPAPAASMDFVFAAGQGRAS